ncbi:MAG: aminotransferase class III-fold pyridoxal phosphate-dependent enzyme, partial [Candidatus Omnitrophica bacterium]|nr:aminotransferase class III-fold pyridoxal phosphate-dependent enzyme [Candidatus Omnitrophota bacterium]
VLDETKNSFTRKSDFKDYISDFDVVATGEALTGYQVPFGAFTMTDQAYAPWNNLENALIHSSTYGGNSLALSAVSRHLLQETDYFKTQPAALEYCRSLEEDDHKRKDAFARYVNPTLVWLYGINGYDLNPLHAQGSVLTVENNGTTRELIDCMAGGGAVARGHAPSDLSGEVLDQHDGSIDYWEKLESLLVEKTGLSHAFPAISGATAVDQAMSMSMLANHEKTQLLILRGNYAGKTLLSLNGSVIHELDLQKPFKPLYHDVVYLDPFEKGIEAQLKQYLSSKKIALVWMELIHGTSNRAVPEHIIDLIAEYKKEGGYLIGVDEVLTGFYRTGVLFAFQRTRLAVDVLSLSKAMSDGTFPIGATMASHDVYHKALRQNEQYVRWIEMFYKNQLGSHISVHGIEKLLKANPSGHVREVSGILKSGFKSIALESPLMSSIDGDGFMLHIQYAYDHWLLKILGKAAKMLFPVYASGLVLKEQDIFLAVDRCLPAITLSKDHATTIVSRMRALFTQDSTRIVLGFYGFIFKLAKTAIYNTLIKRG